MTCRQLVDFLAEYVADGLEVSERTAFAAHLADCPACADYVRSYRDTIALAKDAARDDEAAVAAMPPELVDAISGRTRASLLNGLCSPPTSLGAPFAPIWRALGALATWTW